MACWHILIYGLLAMLIYQHINNVVMALTAALKEQNGEVKATFRLPIELMKKLKYMAIDNNTSVNALVVKALTDLIKADNQEPTREEIKNKWKKADSHIKSAAKILKDSKG
jgi:hypothetical protein